MGGGPGFRVHQFGGARPRRRPRDANAQTQQGGPGWASLSGLLPILALFLFPLISSLFSGPTPPPGPSFRFDGPISPHTMHRTTPKLKVDYYVNPVDVDDFSSRKFSQLDSRVESEYVGKLRYECDEEIQEQDRRIMEAQGWFFPDVEKMKAARAMELKACRRLDSLKGRRY